MTSFLLVFLGGGLGCVLRYLIGRSAVQAFSNFPLATILANLLSCVIMGLVIFLYKKNLHFESLIRPLLLIGFCGGLSTFSTFSFESLELIRSGFWGLALLNIAVSILVCMGALFYLTK